jgi:hypothetical protein
MSIALAFFAALSAAVVVMTFAHTLAEYPSLPDRVPLHLRYNGTVDNWGPRSSVWLLPGLQVVVAAVMVFSGYALVTGMPGTHGSVLGLAFFAPCVLAILWRAQLLLISAAKSGGKRVAMGGFWLFFAAMLAAGTLGVVFL